VRQTFEKATGGNVHHGIFANATFQAAILVQSLSQAEELAKQGFSPLAPISACGSGTPFSSG
jgi:hypothetical protein